MLREIGGGYLARGYVAAISASYFTAWNLMQGGGINHYGVPSAFTNFEVSCGGTGALYVKDGEASCAAMFNPEGDMGEVETWETLEPLLYLGRGLKPSTGGPGKYRGGTGSEALRMLFKTSSQTIFNRGAVHVMERFGLPLYGVVMRKASDGSWVADEEKTVGKRAEIRAARLSESRDAKDFFAAQRKRVLAKDFIRPVREMYKSSLQLSPEWAPKYRSYWPLTDAWSF